MTRQKYFWIVCVDPDTQKPFLIAGGETEADARHKGLDVLGSIDFEIRGLPTRNLQAASSMVRGKRLDETHSLRKASERLGHDRSIKRLIERRRHRPL